MFDILFTLNYLAIFFCGIAFMVLGSLWYSPLLLGNRWCKLMGINLHDKHQIEKMKKESSKAYLISFLASLVLATVLASILKQISPENWLWAAKTAACLWLGFIAMTAVINTAFGSKKWELTLIDTSFHLVTVLAMSQILFFWK